MIWIRLAAPALFDLAVAAVEAVLGVVVLCRLSEFLVVLVLDASEIAYLPFRKLEVGTASTADNEIRD